jgi:ABC-type Mn2+/Zn2+ transport system ATPase subunit
MDIIIKNCNSIDSAQISIEQGRLNIKYGFNGIGKSTIAKAIELNIADGNLAALTPFKFKDKQNDVQFRPTITGADPFKSISIFNDEYINQFVFKKDEIIQNSFNIFIKNADYDKKMGEIENLVSNIKDTFKNDEKLEGIIKDLMDMSESFGKSKDGYSKAGRIGKAIGSGNKIENIPAGLEGYSDFIRSGSNVQWIKWQIEGNKFSDISTTACPYCLSSIIEKKETILSVSKEYDAKSIEHLNILCAIIERLGRYFSKDTLANLESMVKNKTSLQKEEITYLTTLKAEIEILKEKLNDMKTISFFSFKDVDKVVEKITSLKINMNVLPRLGSDDTKQIVDTLNGSLDAVLLKAGLLQGEINKQKEGIQKTIKKHKQDINEFLKYAGYKYTVDIENDGETYKMKLKYGDLQETIDDAETHLSFGEKNAFSLVLFMYESLSKNPDLIILDDPISSFDRNKKFAIIEMLFLGNGSFRSKTVLMLTHDIEPITDFIKTLAHKFNSPHPTAHFLQSKADVLSEIAITKSDIISFAQVCNENIVAHNEDIIKLIYLRRYYEILDDKGMEYQLLSNLFHKRTPPEIQGDAVSRLMTQQEIDAATDKIKLKVPNFDFASVLARINEDKDMVDIYKSACNNYEKLQLFRIINSNHESDVIKKYINETFHIENEYVMQLNPHKYDFVPEYIIAECDEAVLAM